MTNPVEGGKDLVRRAGPGASGARSLLVQVRESASEREREIDRERVRDIVRERLCGSSGACSLLIQVYLTETERERASGKERKRER